MLEVKKRKKVSLNIIQEHFLVIKVKICKSIVPVKVFLCKLGIFFNLLKMFKELLNLRKTLFQ